MISGGLRGVKESTVIDSTEAARLCGPFLQRANFVTPNETRVIFRASCGKVGDSLSTRLNQPLGSNVKRGSHSLFIATYGNVSLRPFLAARRFPFE